MTWHNDIPTTSSPPLQSDERVGGFAPSPVAAERQYR